MNAWIRSRSRGVVVACALAVLGAAFGGGCGSPHSGGKPRGIALTIGLNEVDPAHYGGRMRLNACEFDANDMADIAKKQGFATTTLLTAQATRKAVAEGIAEAAKTLKSGDLFLLTYAGHGGQVADQNGDEKDKMDETWCLYDGELLDDELAVLWTKFKAGVRVSVFSDSCHSGTVTTVAVLADLAQRFTVDAPGLEERFEAARKPERAGAPDFVFPVRELPSDLAQKVYDRNKVFYEGLGKGVAGEADSESKIACTVILISACQDDETTGDGTKNGAFTHYLKEVWANGAFQGSYQAFRDAIAKKFKNQTPGYSVVPKPDAAFEGQRPFTI